MTMTQTTAVFHQLRVSTTSAILLRSQQELDVTLGPGDRARCYANYGPALALNPGPGFAADALVDSGIADDSTLAHFLAAGLELRFYQRDQLRARPSQLQRRFEHLGEPDEARIADDDVD